MSKPNPSPKRPLSPERRAAINRQNARKSTGPKTPAGKARARANALKHGLAVHGVVQTPELEAAFQTRAESYAAAFPPANDLERDLLQAAALGAARLEQARHHAFAAARTQAARAA